ncbi:MAG TPA: porin [Burkholderiales bacterium]
MKLKRITLATLAAFAAPGAVLAQSNVQSVGNIQIYGTLNVDIESVKATGSSGLNFPSRSRVTSNSSNLGFRGTEDLGQGLRAFFQIESAVNLDNGTQSGFLASRNSAAGLLGNWGQAFLGQWDSPYKNSTLRLDPTGDTGIAGYTGILGGTGSITAGQGGATFAERASFSRRVANVVQYWTPNWRGVSGRVAYGTSDTNVGSTANGVSEASNLRPALYAGSVMYEAGPLYVTAAYERHKDFQALNTLFNAAASSGKDDAWKGAVQYTFLTNFTVGGILERLKYKADDIGGLGALERKVTNWYLVGKYQAGPHAIGLSYGQKGEEKLSGAGLSDLSDSKAKQISARYGYSLSKRTQLYAVATRISNEANAFQTFGNSPITSTTLFRDPARGADPTGFGGGIIHTF